MSEIFDQHIDEGNRLLQEIFESPDVDEGEKKALAEAFYGEIKTHLNEGDDYQDSAALIYGASLKYIDNELSSLLSKENATDEECERAVRLCRRQKSIIEMFASNKWKAPRLINTRPDRMEAVFTDRIEANALRNRLIEDDEKLDDLIEKAKTSLANKDCELMTSAFSAYVDNFNTCQSRKIEVLNLKHKDIAGTKNQISQILDTAAKYRVLNNKICDLDFKLTNYIMQREVAQEQWDELISLGKQQEQNIIICQRNKWPLPDIKCKNPENLASQYQHYKEMISLDNILSTQQDSLTKPEQYEEFFEYCSKQESNIKLCDRNGWKQPDLNNNNPNDLAVRVKSIKNRQDFLNRVKRNVTLAAVGLVLLAIAGVVIRYLYIRGKLKVPFDSTFVIGQDVDTVCNELEDAGFENIRKISSNEGWLDSNKVVRISIDNTDSFNKGTYVDPKTNVEITYSNEGRSYVTDLLKDWKHTNYESVKTALKNAGFTNIMDEEVATSEKDKDKIVAAISLNGDMYTNEYCYLPLDAPISISYYSLKLGIGNDSSQLIGQDYREVVSSLEGIGFVNVNTQEIKTGWAKNNTVIGVTVNNSEEYNSDERFDPNVKIVVKYSSDDRTDATQVLENWQEQNYNELKKALGSKGFKKVEIKAITTDEVAKNNKINSIVINNEGYVAGDCYLQKNASITIEYYELQIEIGQKSSSFKKEPYKDVVETLKNKGFTNIKVLRSNDLINGVLNKESSVKSITINGEEKFDADAVFRYDSEVVIIVNTFKDKGCEEITEVAE